MNTLLKVSILIPVGFLPLWLVSPAERLAAQSAPVMPGVTAPKPTRTTVEWPIAQPASTQTLAQIVYDRNVRSNVPFPLLDFGRTETGQVLELDQRSLRFNRQGVRFVYYLNGQQTVGVAQCRDYTWATESKRYKAVSAAAIDMLHYICGADATVR